MDNLDTFDGEEERNKSSVEPEPLKVSARKKCFVGFDLGFTPTEMANILHINPKTSYRYYQDWKQVPEGYSYLYEYVKKVMRDLPPEVKHLLAFSLAVELGCPTEEVMTRMQQPWAYKQIVTGEWRKWAEGRPAPILGMMDHVKLRLGLKMHPEVREILKIALGKYEWSTDKTAN